MSLRCAIRRRVPATMLATLLSVAIGVTAGVTSVAAETPPPQPVHTFATSGDLDAVVGSGADAERLQASASTSLALSARSLCGPASRTAVVDGRPILVSLPPAATFKVGALPSRYWAAPPSRDAAWQLWFYSMRWAQGVVRRALDDGQAASMTAVTDQVLRFYVEHPDDRAGSVRPGWDEGSSLRRLETLNCLYAATEDKRIRAAMATEVGVLTGRRYYGPPYHAVHNHGLMANQRIVTAGTLIGRADWVRIARARIIAEAPRAFTAAGTTFEQSSGYHQVNANMWRNTAALLQSLDPNDPTPASIRTTLAKAQRVLQWFTEPDGLLVQIGDATRVPGLAASAKPVSTFRDTQAGLLIGRWSWTDPHTSYYTVRYGPRRWAHGHFDKASVTWTTRGARVLVGPGYTSTPAQSSAIPWHRTPVAHNTSAPFSGKFHPAAGAVLRSSSHTGSSATSTVEEAVYGVKHRRTTRVDHARRTMTVGDSYPRGVRSRQTWHLDPAWTQVSAPAGGTTMRFAHPSGRSLTVTTTGRVSSAIKGRAGTDIGWTYVTTTQRLASYQLTIRSMSNAVTTSFKVS